MFCKISLLFVLVIVCFGSRTVASSNQISINPVQMTWDVGETAEILCIWQDEPLAKCQFQIPDYDDQLNIDPFQPPANVPISYSGKGLEKGECGMFLKVEEKHHGKITCQLTSTSAKMREATMTLIVAKKPKDPVLSLNNETYVEGSTVTASCVVADGRPPATITWALDGNKNFNYTSKPQIDGSEGNPQTVSKTATWVVSPDDDQKVLTCSASHHSWKEEMDASKTITVHYKPRIFDKNNEIKEDIQFSKLTLGMSAPLIVKAKANPAPTSVQMTIDNKTLTVGQNGDEKYQLSELEKANGYFIYSLTIKNLTKEDVTKVGLFNVTNPKGWSMARLTFDVGSPMPDTTKNTEKPKEQAIAGNTTTGIIIAVSVIIIILMGVLMFAKFNKKWCFAKKHSYYIKNREGDFVKAGEEDQFL